MNEQQSDVPAGPNSVCPTCGGFGKVSHPRLYMIRATEDTNTGMTIAQWWDCRRCAGNGQVPGTIPPV